MEPDVIRELKTGDTANFAGVFAANREAVHT